MGIYGPSATLQLRGMRELLRDLQRANNDMAKTVRSELKEAAEPVRVTAEGFAGAEIANIGPRWGQMRIGTRIGSVYVAPRSRRRPGGSPRPNLGRLLMVRALLPAIDKEQRSVERGVERALDRMLRSHNL